MDVLVYMTMLSKVSKNIVGKQSFVYVDNRKKSLIRKVKFEQLADACFISEVTDEHIRYTV